MVLEATQEDLGVMNGALEEIATLRSTVASHEAAIEQHERAARQLQEALDHEKEKTEQYEQHIVEEQTRNAAVYQKMQASVQRVAIEQQVAQQRSNSTALLGMNNAPQVGGVPAGPYGGGAPRQGGTNPNNNSIPAIQPPPPDGHPPPQGPGGQDYASMGQGLSLGSIQPPPPGMMGGYGSVRTAAVVSIPSRAPTSVAFCRCP